jgi:hypothetical protein
VEARRRAYRGVRRDRDHLAQGGLGGGGLAGPRPGTDEAAQGVQARRIEMLGRDALERAIGRVLVAQLLGESEQARPGLERDLRAARLGRQSLELGLELPAGDLVEQGLAFLCAACGVEVLIPGLLLGLDPLLDLRQLAGEALVRLSEREEQQGNGNSSARATGGRAWRGPPDGGDALAAPAA